MVKKLILKTKTGKGLKNFVQIIDQIYKQAERWLMISNRISVLS